MSTKIKIFIDFWNVQLSWNDYHHRSGNPRPPRIPWDKILPGVLVQKLGNGCLYQGTHVYASINPRSQADRKLHAFLKIMNTFQGYSVIVKERIPAKPIHCVNPDCRKLIATCPYCNVPLIRTTEKGVDAALLSDLFQLAIDNVYDSAILVSDDGDFVPAVNYIQLRGKYITHAGFRGRGDAIRQTCWDHFYLDDIMGDLLSIEDTQQSTA